LKEKSFPAKLKNNLSQVYSAVLSMNDIVNLLLEVSRFELGGVNVSEIPLHLDKVITEIIKQKSKAILAKDIKVSLTNGKTPEFIGDEKLIGVIIENLLNNSIKYTPPGGKIDISLTNKNESILFKISDTGIGIPVDDQPKIFTKLFRGGNVKLSQQGGLGLGLYLVRLVIDLKGGKIWFESTEGVGTTFFVEFPKKIKAHK